MSWLWNWLTNPEAINAQDIAERFVAWAAIVGVPAGLMWKGWLWFAGRGKRKADASEARRSVVGRTEELPYEAVPPDKEVVFGSLRGVAGDRTDHVKRPEIEKAISDHPDGLLIWGPAGCGKTREAAEYALARAQTMRRNQWCFVIDGSASLKSPQEAPGFPLDGAVVIFDDLQEHWRRHQELTAKGLAVGLHPGEIICEILNYFRGETDKCVAVATVRIEDEAVWREMCADPRMGEALGQFAPHVRIGLVNRTTVERDYLRAACEAREVTCTDDKVFDALVQANDGSFLTADEYLDELSGDGPHELTMAEAQGLDEACRQEWRERVLPRLPAMQQEAVELCSILSACRLPLRREFVLALDRERNCRGPCAGIRYNWGRGKTFSRALDALAEGAFPESEGEFRPHGSRLADEGRPDLRGEAAQAGRALIGLAGVDRGDTRRQRDLSSWLDRIGSELVTRGDVGAAMQAYEGTHEIFSRLAASDPGNAQWQYDLGISHERIGTVHQAQGDLAGALTAFEAKHGIIQRLAASDPGNAEWQRDLAVSHNKIGDVRVAQGDLARAVEAYETSLEIAERLAEADPDNAQWQRDLSVSHNKIGDVRSAQGDLAGALAAFEADLKIAEHLAEADPGNAQWQRDLSVSHNKIGNVRQAQGNLAGALEAYEADLKIAERLAESDPGNAQWQRDVSVSHEKIGDVRQAQGDLERALAAHETSLEIRKRLAKSDPDNAGWQHDLSLVRARIGQTLEAQGDLAGARRAYEASLGIFKSLAASDPGNARWQRDLAVSHYKLAHVANEAEDAEREKRHLLECREVFRGMKAQGMHLDPPMAGVLERLEGME